MPSGPEDDEDDASPHRYESPPRRYESPPRHSYHSGMPPPDPYAARWTKLDALHDFVHGDVMDSVEEMKAFIRQFKAVQASV